MGIATGSTSAPSAPRPGPDADCLDVLKALAKCLGLIGLYNQPEHPSVQAVLLDALDKLGPLFQKAPALVYLLLDEQVLLNGAVIGPMRSLPQNLASSFQRHKVRSLSLKWGVTAEELGVLCAALAARPGAGAQTPAEQLAERGIRAIALNEAEVSIGIRGQKAAGAGAATTGVWGGLTGGVGGATAAKPDVNAQFVRTQFGRYMSPELVEKLAACPQELKLGGVSRVITVLFADIRGFTTLAEGMTPQQVTAFINAFLTPMTRVLLDHDAFIDKYIGDCVMAFWNAPLGEAAHARKACAAALAMRARLAELNSSWQSPVRMGIGINTGLSCVGNVGSEQRFEYSAIGDTVNLAARLEGQSKVYGFDVVIGEQTRAQAPELAAIELDLLRVKGKSVPERLFGLLGGGELAASEGFRRLASVHGAFLKAFRARAWDEAERLLGSCLATGFPLAPFCELYRGRIGVYRRYPPAPDWDGVFTAAQK